MISHANLEKPWYVPAIEAFLCFDVPRLTGISRQQLARDFSTLVRRLSTEGESFLTKTLPDLGKSIDLALQGRSPLSTLAFKKKRGTALPVFLQALLGRIFQDDGWVRDDLCTEALRLTRQICFWCKKIEKGYSDESLRKTVADLIEIDRNLPAIDACIDSRTVRVARAIVRSIFRKGDRFIQYSPQHGPGSVAGGDDVVKKRMFRRKFLQLEKVFRPIPNFFSLRDASESPSRVVDRMACEYGLSETHFVEKDSSGPRVIGLEPAEYQWCQQRVKNFLYDHLEQHRITKGRINFTDQSINRGLTAKWADFDTLDMSKASDRNSFALVRSLFEKTWIWPWLQASRTPGTRLPDGSILMFKKFAPMGSATCFPVQATVYYALACACLHVQGGYPLQVALRNVYVYGDDLVVPHGSFAILKDCFESVGLRFNEAKCCISGKFRESCGMDSYDGVEVTPIRMRKVYPGRSTTDLIPLVKHANSLYLAGYRASSQSFRDAALATFPALRGLRLPCSPRTDLPILYWVDDLVDTVKYHTTDGITRVKGWYFRPLGVESHDDAEVYHLRESLSRGGPVGWLRSSRETVVRVLDRKYSGILRKKRFAIVRELGQ